jgi:outer membrane biosynthesis protein TonB
MFERNVVAVFACLLVVLAGIEISHLLHPPPIALPKPNGIRKVVLTPNPVPAAAPLARPRPIETQRFAITSEPASAAAPVARQYPDAHNPAPPGKPLTAPAGPAPGAYGLANGDGSGDTIGGGGGEGAAGGATGGDPSGEYAKVIAADMRAALLQDRETNTGIYTLTLRAWIAGDGHVDRADVETSSGDLDLDRAIRRVLQHTTLSRKPPLGLAQPVRLRLTATRG